MVIPTPPRLLFGPADVAQWDAATIDSHQGHFADVLTDDAVLALRERLLRNRALVAAIDIGIWFEVSLLAEDVRLTRSAVEACQDFIASTSVPCTLGPGNSSSVWAIEVTDLREWTGFSTEDALDFIQGRRVSRYPYGPSIPYDANWPEHRAYDFMSSACLKPMLAEILTPVLPQYSFENLLEVNTPVNSRPDALWHRDGKPILVHEHKAANCCPCLSASTRGDLDIQNLVNYAPSYTGGMAPINQLFSYMVVLGLRFGVLSTTEYTWFFYREETEDEAVLHVSRGFHCLSTGEEAVRLAYLQILLYAHMDDGATGMFPGPTDALYTTILQSWRSRLDRNPPRDAPAFIATPEARDFVSGVIAAFQGGRRVGLLEHAPAYLPGNTQTSAHAAGTGVGGGDGTGTGARARDGNDATRGSRLPLSRDEFESILPVPWAKSFEHVADASLTNVKRLTLQNGLRIYLKTYIVHAGGDVANGGDEEIDEHRRLVMNEVNVYDALRDIQGGYIPILIYGGPVGQPEHNINVVATLDMGLQITSDKEALGEARKCLDALHMAGFSHEAILPPHFVRDAASGHFHVLNFARAKRLPVSEKERDKVIAREVRDMKAVWRYLT